MTEARKSSMDDDRDLVRRALRRDKKAFEMIVQKYQRPLYNYIGRLIPDRETAQDYTQEVFLKAYASLKSYRPSYPFSTWLFRIASHHVIDSWRKKKIPLVSLDQPLSESEESPAGLHAVDEKASVVATLEASELRDRIEKAIEKLPPPLRELFLLRHISGFSYKEIAEIKRLPVGTVKNRVFQAKEMLRLLLEKTSCPA